VKNLIHHITNFYLYSSFHIGLCSVYLYLFTISRFDLKLDLKYLLFTLSSTVFVYSIHRLIGINKVKKFAHKGRFAIIEKFRSHILIYAIISFGGCCYLFFNFDWSRIVIISGAGVVSVLYTIPVFGKSMRLRDFSFVKIFIIAVVWSYVTGYVPMYEQGLPLGPILIYFIEVIFFFIAITIPFDIRDYYVDAANKVGTIPTLVGKKRSILISLLLLLITLLMDIYMTYQYGFEMNGLICIFFTCLITARIVYVVKDKESDYYFSGLLDTSIMFPYSLYVFIQYFLSAS